MCRRRVLIVVDATFGVNVGDLLPNAPFAGSDGTDTFQQFPKIIFSENAFPLFHSVVVQHKPLADIFVKDFGGPDAEFFLFSSPHPPQQQRL